MTNHHLLDLDLIDFSYGKVPTKSWEVEMPSLPSQKSRDTFTVLLKYMESLTGTQIAINEKTSQLNVSGKDEITIRHTMDHLSNMNTAFVCEHPLE
jgi:hypothetical protein